MSMPLTPIITESPAKAQPELDVCPKARMGTLRPHPMTYQLPSLSATCTYPACPIPSMDFVRVAVIQAVKSSLCSNFGCRWDNQQDNKTQEPKKNPKR